MGLRREIKNRLSKMNGRLRREGRRLASVVLCGVMVAGNLSAVPVSALADSDSDNEYTYEIEGTALKEALQEAVAEGYTVNEDLEFAGEHAEEYAELLEADGTLYELELSEEDIDEDDDRDKALDLRVFARIEGDIPVDEIYEIDGSEEIVFLVSNKTEKTATATIRVDGLETDVITILPVDSIPVEEESTAVESMALTTTVSSGTSAGGSGGGFGGSVSSTAAATEADEDEIVIAITAAADEDETEADAISEDTSVAILKEKDSDESVSAEEEDAEINGQAEDAGALQEEAAADAQTEDTKSEDTSTADADTVDGEIKDADTTADTDISDADTKDSSKAEAADSAAGSDAGYEESDKNSSETNRTEDVANSDAEVGGSNGSAAESDAKDSEPSDGGNNNDNDVSDDAGSGSGSDITEDSEVSVLGSAISVHNSILLATGKATDSDANETASPSDADKEIDGIAYESVRFDKKGAAAFATTAADLKLDEIEETESEETIEYTAEADGVSVTVTASEGALPEGAELSVTVYEEDSDEYAAAAEAIDYTAEDTTTVVSDEDTAGTASGESTKDTTSASTGLAVLDISFTVDGEEVEPTEAVTVSIDASGIVPEDADTSTIEVQHLTESGNSLEATLVADAEDQSDGIIDADNVVAEFEVESFSTFTITWRSSDSESVDTNDSTITCNVYGRTSSSEETYNELNGTGIAVVLTEGMEYNFMNGDNATIESDSNSGQGGGPGGPGGQGGQGSSSYVYEIDYAEVISDGTTYKNVQTISYDGSTYTITYTVTDDNGDTTTVTVTGLTDITVNLYYTRASSSSNQELDLSSYNEDAYVWWDTFNGETDENKASVAKDDREHIYSVKLNDLEVEGADSSTTNDNEGWGEGKYTLSDYFPGGSTTTAVYSTLEITPVAGYYVTKVVVACTGNSSMSGNQGSGGSTDGGGIQTPYNCKTWGDDNAFVTTFNVGTSGTVTIDVSSLAFSHSSNSDNYFILICVAPIPSPLYVEYDYGEIVNYINESTYVDNSDGEYSSAFSTADGWTTTSTEENSYGSGYSDENGDGEPGIKTEDTQYKYAYAGEDNAEEAANWKHYANTITDDAEKQAAAVGYVFAGWKAEYYTTVTVEEQTAKENGYQYDYNKWIYTFTDSYGSTTTYYEENEEVNLATNVRLIAQWIPIGITVTKIVTGLADTSFANSDQIYKLQIQVQEVNSEGNETWTDFGEAIELAVTVDGEASTTIYPIPAGTYRVVETDGNGNLSDDTYTYYITVDTGDNITFTYSSDYIISTINGTNVALISSNLTVTNSYTTGVDLPETGGPGTTPFRIAGLLITSCSAYLIYRVLRRRKEWMKY